MYLQSINVLLVLPAVVMSLPDSNSSFGSDFPFIILAIVISLADTSALSFLTSSTQNYVTVTMQDSLTIG